MKGVRAEKAAVVLNSPRARPQHSQSSQMEEDTGYSVSSQRDEEGMRCGKGSHDPNFSLFFWLLLTLMSPKFQNLMHYSCMSPQRHSM